MSQNVNFKLTALPPHLRMQAERQLSNERNPKHKITLQVSSGKRVKSPIRVPKKRVPNQTEARYEADHFPGKGLYEAFSFKCPSGHYTPDWIHFTPSGRIVAVEVKGSFAFGSQAAASAKFKECVALYPEITWIWARYDKGVWQCGYYGHVGPKDAHL